MSQAFHFLYLAYFVNFISGQTVPHQIFKSLVVPRISYISQHTGDVRFPDSVLRELTVSVGFVLAHLLSLVHFI